MPFDAGSVRDAWDRAADSYADGQAAGIDQYFGFSRPIRQNMNASDTAWLTGLRNSYSAQAEVIAALKAVSHID